MIERTERLATLLQDAILIAEGAGDETMSRHLRNARLSLHEWTGAGVPVRVDLLSGRVFARGLPVPLTRTELALVVALALNERGIARQILVDDLYPGLDAHSSANAVKVTVHRVRRRIGLPGVIRYEAGRYVLGDMVEVELARLEAELRHLSPDEPLDAERAARLERLRQRILDGRPAFMLEWPWFDDTELRLRDLAHDLTVRLARCALRAEHYERAVLLATELAREDPLDEIAAETAIRAFLLAGNRTSAVLEYRRYASALKREIDSRPSPDLRALVGAP